MKSIRVGSRESPLAIAQARLVMDAIARHRPDLRTELVAMKTTGDKILDRPLETVGGKGLFVKELHEALRRGEVDICVHSYKDMPVPADPLLPVVATTAREDPRDVLILPQGCAEPLPDKPIGTSSPRRRAQIARLFPGRKCEPIRGNIQTRLRKLDTGEFGALVLAAAGVKRLGLWARVSRTFSFGEMLPAACQGVLAIQGRADGEYGYLSGLHCPDARDACLAERAFVEALGADCASPVAALAAVDGQGLSLDGLVVDGDGAIRRDSRAGRRENAARIGEELAKAMRR